MQTIEVKKGLKIELDDLIMGLSRLDVQELTTFFEKLNQHISLGEQALTRQRQEILLLKEIKAMIPASVVRRFKVLQKKQHFHPLSQLEQAEMFVLIDFLENKSAERVYLLSTLAKLRQIPITELVKQLNLKHFHG
ncbi:MAG: hypothetical protein RIS64_4416 [Bacteroidota bacterium]|jgi:hypothetical protein